MRRSIILSVLLLSALLITSSCDLNEELSYIDYMGTRYNVVGATYENSDDGKYVEWYVQIGTGDRVYDDSKDYWYGTDPVVRLDLCIDDGEYEYTFLDIKEVLSPGFIDSVYIDYQGLVEPLPHVRSPDENRITVSKTADLFVVDLYIFMDDGDGELLTGHIVGKMTDITPEPLPAQVY